MNAPVPHIALETVEIDSSDDPLWYRDAVIYQLNIKSFFDANDDGVGDFQGRHRKARLCEASWASTPSGCCPSTPRPRDDGYDIADYGACSPHYGTVDEFKRFRSRRRTSAACG
jgi:maltose alpha-D-glucosyltransferase/alpha-amylase